jgi:Arc/MetJ-type ribon-helix-helix transcriptional regulator
MAKSTGVLHKTKRFQIPKAAEGDTPMMSLRLPAETRRAIDRWAATQDDMPGRSEAIRRLIERGLAAEPAPAKPRRAKRKGEPT